jgi:hypothetical protein
MMEHTGFKNICEVKSDGCGDTLNEQHEEETGNRGSLSLLML